MTVFGHLSPAQQTLHAFRQQHHSGPVVWSRETPKEMRRETLTLGEEEVSSPLSHRLLGRDGQPKGGY